MIWHYTTLHHCRQIAQDLTLRMTPLQPSTGEVPGVWFSTSPDWEPTCAKRALSMKDGKIWDGILGFQDIQELMGLARIGFNEDELDLLTWDEYRRLVSPEYASHLERAAAEMARAQGWIKPTHGPAYWLVSLRPVPVTNPAYVCTQRWNGHEWRLP